MPALFAACASLEPPEVWRNVKVDGAPTARHEAGLVAYKGSLVLLGGRRINPTDVLDVDAGQWVAKSPPPMEIHHFQPVVIGDAIYIVGAMTGGWPNETPVDRVIVYYPERDEYVLSHEIPLERRRGAAGAVAYQGKIYIVGGIVNGHMGGYQPWFDEYDPSTGEWRSLPDAPHARDHFQAVVADNKLYAFAGRTTSQGTGQGIDLTVSKGDIFDFAGMRWVPDSETPSIPTERAGNFAIVYGDEILVGGGESSAQVAAHDEVEAFNVKTQAWSLWPRLEQGRHGSGFAVVEIDGKAFIYTASGCGQRGGEPELDSTERLRVPLK